MVKNTLGEVWNVFEEYVTVINKCREIQPYCSHILLKYVNVKNSSPAGNQDTFAYSYEEISREERPSFTLAWSSCRSHTHTHMATNNKLTLFIKLPVSKLTFDTCTWCINLFYFWIHWCHTTVYYVFTCSWPVALLFFSFIINRTGNKDIGSDYIAQFPFSQVRWISFPTTFFILKALCGLTYTPDCHFSKFLHICILILLTCPENIIMGLLWKAIGGSTACCAKSTDNDFLHEEEGRTPYL